MIIIIEHVRIPMSTEHYNCIAEAYDGAVHMMTKDALLRNSICCQEVKHIVCTRLTSEEVALLPNLVCVHSLSSGYDQYPLDILKKRGIFLCTATGTQAHMAEFVIMALIYMARNMGEIIRNQAAHVWNNVIAQTSIAGKTLGILGVGAIGNEIGRLASCFGMRCVGLIQDMSVDISALHIQKAYDISCIEEMLVQCDYLVNCLSANEYTNGILTFERMRALPSQSVFLNVGRGSVISHDTLYRLLSKRYIRAAVLDVFEHEPLEDTSPLWDLDNCLITPHVIGISTTHFETCVPIILENIIRIKQHNYPLWNQII